MSSIESIFKPYLEPKEVYKGGKNIPSTNHKIYKLSSNENPLGASPKAVAAMLLQQAKLVILTICGKKRGKRACRCLLRLALHIGHRRTKVDVQHIASWRYKCGYGIHAFGFCFRNAAFAFAQMHHFKARLVEKAENVVFCAHTNGATSVIEN